MSNTPDSYTWEFSWASQLVDDSSPLPPTRPIPSSQPGTPTPRSSPVLSPVSSSPGTNHTSTPPSDLSLADGNISFGSVPPPNTPAENHDSVAPLYSLLSQSSAERTFNPRNAPSPRFTKESYGVEPKVLLARLRTVANESEDGFDIFQDAVEERISDTRSWFSGDEEAFCTRNIFNDMGKLTRAVKGKSPNDHMASLNIKSVKSGVINCANSPTAQTAVMCYPETLAVVEPVPEVEVVMVPSLSEVKSSNNIECVKEKMASMMSRMLQRVGAIRFRGKPQFTGHQPNHANLSPGKSCLKPGTSQASTPLDLIEEDSEDSLRIEMIPAPKPPKSGKTVTFAAEPARYKSKGTFNAFKHKKRMEQVAKNMAMAGENPDPDPIDPNSPFASQDEETLRMLRKSSDYRNANERAAILRGALDFLLTVADRVDTDASHRIGMILGRLGDRSIGSYTGEERKYANPHNSANRVQLSMYRSRETAMSYAMRGL
ncbi:hypothetical protein IL306_003804 [Fusarium sp. DS 682]|nr:hypothetical protein IL306_003804 [Fusarium sp. DS 682]